MKEIRYKSVCSDLDNTLLMPDKTLSPLTREHLKKLIAQGVEIVPCTGRAFWSIPREVMEFPGIRYAIVSNGAAIYDIKKGEAIMSCCLREDFAEELIHFLKEEGEYVTYECFIKGQPYTSDSYYNDPADFGIPGERERNYVRSTRIPVADIEEFTLQHAHELDALDVILMPEERDRVSGKIRERFNGIYITTSVDHLIEISHEDSGKHRAMGRLMEYLEIPMEEVIAFGDGENDHEMLRAAGLGVAVANASRICKDSADMVIGESQEEAVALCLGEIFDV